MTNSTVEPSARDPFKELRDISDALRGHVAMDALIQTGASAEMIMLAAHTLVDRALDFSDTSTPSPGTDIAPGE